MRRTPDTPQDRPGDIFYFDRLQQFHKLNRRPRRKRLLRLVVLPALLTCGLLVTVGLLWLTLSDSSEKNVSSDLGEAESHAEAATTPTNGLVEVPPSDAKKLSLESVWNRVRASVVQVRSERGLGSGFVVGEDLVATNHHVVVASTGLKVYFQDGTSAEVEGFAAADVDRDLAVIRVATGEKAIPLSFAQELPSVGDPVAAVSFFERTGGQIASAPNTDRTFIATTAKGEHGYSGGPLVDGEGKVVGMVRGQVPDTPETMAIPAADIRDLIRSSRNSHRPLPVPGAQIEVGRIHGNPDHGIRVSRPGWAIVTVSDRSHIRGCLGHGMYVRGDHNSVDVLGGTIHENGGHGIFLWGSNNILRISGGEISSNQGHGVLVEGDDNVISVSDCRILNNNLRGLAVPRPELFVRGSFDLTVRRMGRPGSVRAHEKRATEAARGIRGKMWSVGVMSTEQGQQVLDGFHEVTVPRRHREVDGVEVRLAVEAAHEVLLRIEIRLAFATAGADEHELAVTSLVRPLETLSGAAETARGCAVAAVGDR